jgi:predicted DsbA family dithiol-disulfide isomerase
VLLHEAQTVGLEKQGAEQALDDEALKDSIKATETDWHQMGISGVPTVVFNRESAVTGAHPQESYKQILQELMNQAN